MGRPARVTRRTALPFYLSKPEVCTVTGLSPVTIWRKVRAGTFPPAVRNAQTGIYLGWKRDDVLAWLKTARRN